MAGMYWLSSQEPTLQEIPLNCVCSRSVCLQVDGRQTMLASRTTDITLLGSSILIATTSSIIGIFLEHICYPVGYNTYCS